MDIYVVQPEDTIYSIADDYGVDVNKLIQDNGLSYPYNLVIGQSIVITYPRQTYSVQQGDTLNSISEAFNITVMQLLRNNPNLSENENLYPGESIVISYNSIGRLTTNGFAYPYIKRETLVKILPNLTYLSVFNYTATEMGEIITYYDDSEIIQIAKDYGTIPLLMLTTLTPRGEANIEIAYDILLSEEYQEKQINYLLNIIKTKGYYGANIVINYLKEANQSLYVNFIRKISERFKQEGYLYFISINPNVKYINDTTGVIAFEQVDYTILSNYVDGMMFLQFVWGTNYGPPRPVSNINEIRAFISYAASRIPSDKLLLGLKLIGYDWELPYMPGQSSAISLNLDAAINLAYNVGSVIQFDPDSQTPFFLYNQINIGAPSQHIVWFIDARSIIAYNNLINEYNLNGVGIWNIMIYYPQIWTIINSQYDIIKLLP